MKINRLFIQEYQQFKSLDIDLTYPAGFEKDGQKRGGQPLDKVCIIGPNGVGKSTLLRIIREMLSKAEPGDYSRPLVDDDFGEWYLGIVCNRESKARVRWAWPEYVARDFFDLGISTPAQLISLIRKAFPRDKRIEGRYTTDGALKGSLERHGLGKGLGREFAIEYNQSKLIYSPHESAQNHLLTTDFFPETTLNEALEEGKSDKQYVELDFGHVRQFWNILLRLHDARESARYDYEAAPENVDKSKRVLLAEFDEVYPDFLVELADTWNDLIRPIGLYFDLETVKIPRRRQDNLEAFIRLVNSNQAIPYKALSSGIRHLLFRIGYFKAQMQAWKGHPVIALFDEPEVSLFPDLQYDLVKRYAELAPDSQLIFATHSPIIAAQFEPCERVILSFDENHNVVAHRGVAPIGDDPNDLLRKDFGREDLMGEQGLEKLEEFLRLQRLIQKEADDEKRRAYIERYLQISNEYGFTRHEKATQAS